MFGKPAFGSTTANAFGSTATSTSLFGQQKPAGSLFGQTQQTQQPAAGGSLFGQQKSLFGSPSQQQNTTLFGSPQQPQQNAASSSLFGQSKPGGLFGSSPAQTNTFGTQNTGGGGLFGSSNTATTGMGSSLFSGASTVTGSTVKFDAPISQDTMIKNGTQNTINTKHMCITAMKAYEGKSFEELRVEDYMANRKAPNAGTTTTGGLFGGGATTSTAPTTSLFGASTQQQKPSLFGQSTTNTFGGSPAQQQTTTSLFGQTNATAAGGTSLFGSKPAGGGLFGTTSQATNTFGTTTGTTSLFGNNAATPAFGAQTQPQQQASLFGTNTGFGATQPAAGGLFSGTTNTGFGQAAAATGGSIFGASSTPATGGLFSKPATSQAGFGFGATTGTTNAFGQTNTGFGSATKPGLFGNTTGGMFNQPAQQQTGTGLFGAQPQQQQQQGGSMFGQQAQVAQATNPTTVQVPVQPIVLCSDAQETQMKMSMVNAALAASPYGDSPLLKLTQPKKEDDTTNNTSVQRQLRFLAAKKSVAHGNTSSLSNGNVSAPSSGVKAKTFLSSVHVQAGSKLRSPSVPVDKDLSYQSRLEAPTLGRGIGSQKQQSDTTLRGGNSILDRSVMSAVDMGLSNSSNQWPSTGRKSVIKHLDLETVDRVMTPLRDRDELPRYPDNPSSESVVSPGADPRGAMIERVLAVREQANPPRMNLDGSSMDESQVEWTDASNTVAQPASRAQSESQISSGTSRTTHEVSQSEDVAAGISMKSTDYYCQPTIRAMKNMVVDGKVVLPDGLTIGRAGYGNVFWAGRMELSNIVLDEVVIFRHKEVTVYPDDSLKPAEGEELNRPAEVTLERVWHVDKQTKKEIKDPLELAEFGWRERLERVTARMGATFKDYRPGTGSWVFRVDHFSKYGLPDDEGKDEEMAQKPGKPAADLHAKVQRQPLRLEPPEVQGAQEVDADDIMVEIDSSDTSMWRDGMKRGLGGEGLLHVVPEHIPEMMGAVQISPPEKKPKIELDILDKSRQMLDSFMVPAFRSENANRAMISPKCQKPVRQFHGVWHKERSSFVRPSVMIDPASTFPRCRSGFSAAGQFSVCMQPMSNRIEMRSIHYFEEATSPDMMTDMLEHNIRLTQSVARNHSVSARVRHCELDGARTAPRLKPLLNEHAQLTDSFIATARQSKNSELERLWKLFQALFNFDENSPTWHKDQTRDVGDWLRKELSTLKYSHTFDPNDKLHKTWWLVSVGRLEEAACAAIEVNTEQTAALLSLAAVDPRATRQHFATQLQLDFWEAERVLDNVDRSTLRLYMVMAGRIGSSLKLPHGTLNVHADLDWKQSLGLFVWYVHANGDLEDPWREYLKCIEKGLVKSAKESLPEQLLSLVCDRTHSIEAVLDATGRETGTDTNEFLSWHLWSALRAFGHNTMDPSSEQRMHRAYAERLYDADLPHLALFVLAHIGNDQCRTEAMREMLIRVAATPPPGFLDKLSEVCEVPMEWIAAHQFVRARANENWELACELAVRAGELVEAQRILVSEVGPHCVVLGELDVLRKVLQHFEPVVHLIPNWGPEAQIYNDYVSFKSLANVDDEEASIVELLTTLEMRLQGDIFKSPIQKLCVQTIGAEVAAARELLEGVASQALPLAYNQFATAAQQ